MPLDLSPCEGLPRYQPTFDLSKKRFMPHKNIPTVRELVKAKQEERSEPINNEFLERMEDSLMRWKPPASSHRGTTMAIDGVHPYQLPTAAMKKSSKKVGLRSSSDNAISINNDSVLDSFNQWWRTGKLNMLNKKENNEGGDDDDDRDDFSFNFGQEDINAVSGYTETMVRTPYAVPITYPREATVADRESILLNEQAIYQQYYNNPVPADYLAVSHRSRHDNDLHHYQQQQQQQQQQQKFFLTIYLNWVKTCFATCSDH